MLEERGVYSLLICDAELVMCGHSLGSGVAALLGLVIDSIFAFCLALISISISDVGGPKDLPDCSIEWPSRG